MYRLKLWVFLLPVALTVCVSAPPAGPAIVTDPAPVEQPAAAVEQPVAEQAPAVVEQAPEEQPAAPAVAVQPPAPAPVAPVQQPPAPAPATPVQQPPAPAPAAPVQQPAAPAQVAVEEPPVVEDPKDKVPEIYRELYDPTLSEIQIFARDHDALIRAKNFAGWKNNLTDERFEEIASAEFLKNASQSPLLSSRRITLRTANDYFLNVVFPAHSSTRVDEIEFITENNVKVYFITSRAVRNSAGEARTETTRLRLYELIKIDGAWKIVN